ncbi:PAS domain S-box protein [Chitinimonas arctica]|uniref:histidine kinase n=1 Tax=Chitinimonas arctica TaxID=2594795 RepID=A0A516SHF1_9NEIS|nr:PAS domain-containing protein [Chitinimonas arctica]QDQ27550.1 PAS domain S-box protein [Chitinimonas arctica]
MRYTERFGWRRISPPPPPSPVDESWSGFYRLAEISPNLLYIYDLSTRRNVYVNAQITRLFGYTEADLQALGDDLLPRLIHPDDLPLRLYQLSQLHEIADGEVIETVFRLLDAKGVYRWVYTRDRVFKRAPDGQCLQLLGLVQDLSSQLADEIHLAERDAALNDTERRLQLALQAGGLGVWDWEVRSGRLVWESHCYAIFGLPPDSNKQMYLADFERMVLPVDLPMVQATYSSAVANRGLDRYSCEFRIVRPDGQVRWLAGEAIIQRNSAGEALRVIGTVQDISERHRLLQSQRDNEYRLRMTLDGIRQGTWSYRPASGCFFADAQAAHLHGLPAEHDCTMVQQFSAQIRAADWARIRARAPAIFAAGSELRFEYRAMQADGSERWLSVIGHPLPEGDTYFGIVQDINESRLLRDSLAENVALLSTLLENAPVGICYVDKQLVNQHCNAKSAALHGLQVEEMIGRTVAEISPANWSEVEPYYRTVLETGQAVTRVEISAPDPQGGVITYQADYYPVRVGDEAPIGIGVMLYDITPHTRAAQEMLAAKLKAEEASTAKDHFLAVLSHELRTPLTPVLLAARTLEGDPALPAHLLPRMVMMRRNVELEVKLIDDLLDLTRITRGRLNVEMGRVDLHDLIRHAAHICLPQLRDKLQMLDLVFEASESVVVGDGPRLQQVLWNLISNSVKFSQEGGRITIHTSNSLDGRLLVRVSDEGVGIHAELLPRVFDAFEQGGVGMNRQFGGLGLGLAISLAIAELHCGQLSASSPGHGQGATFTLALPVAGMTEDTRPAMPQDDPPALPPNTDPARILLVEDHPDSAEMLAFILSLRGWSVVVAQNIAQALSLAENQRFDVMVSDVGLPDGSGLDLLKRLRAAGHGLPAIALSGYGHEDDVAASHAAGFAHHLTKPARGDQVENAIEELLAQRGATLAG